jgi:hypothetical protein
MSECASERTHHTPDFVCKVIHGLLIYKRKQYGLNIFVLYLSMDSEGPCEVEKKACSDFILHFNLLGSSLSTRQELLVL